MNEEIVSSQVYPVIFTSFALCVSSLNPSAGVLACLDGYMNIALEQTEEYVNGQLKNTYGDAFIQGNNGNSPSLYSYIASTIGLFLYNQITSRFTG